MTEESPHDDNGVASLARLVRCLNGGPFLDSDFDFDSDSGLRRGKPFGIREAAYVGMYAQSLMLGMTAFGLASCPQTSLGFHADLVREVLNVDPANKLLFGMSFGYEDTADPINNARLGRAELDASTVFHD